MSKFIYSCLSFKTPRLFFNWFIMNHTVHNYNTVTNVNINMKNYFELDGVSVTNALHTKGSRLVNYGGKMLKVAGPILWNSLPLYIRNAQSVHSLKYLLKKFLIEQYD